MNNLFYLSFKREYLQFEGKEIPFSILSHRGGQMLVEEGTVITRELHNLILQAFEKDPTQLFISKMPSMNKRGVFSLSLELKKIGVEIPSEYSTDVTINLKNDLIRDKEKGQKLTLLTSLDFESCINLGNEYQRSMEFLADYLNFFLSRKGKSLEIDVDLIKLRQRKLLENILNETVYYPDTLAYAATLRASQGDYTYQHLLNVTKWAVLIASYINVKNRLNLSGKVFSYDLKQVALEALLHDIGKLDPKIQRIIYQPRKLDVEEFKLVKLHPVKGKEILKDFEKILTPSTLDTVLYHHVRYNCRGYPEGISTTQILPITALVAVADCFEAIFYRSFYRSNLYSKIEAEEILLKEIYENSEFFYKKYANFKWEKRENLQELNDPFFIPLVAIHELIN